jgi:Cu(I)/Ag(I) efflux system membrane fusion protein
MNRVLAGVVLLLLLSGTLGAGYWVGGHRALVSASSTNASVAPVPPARAEERKVLYYRDPMGKPEYSPTPKKDSMGMDFIPVYEGEEEAQDAGSARSAAPAQGAAPAQPQPQPSKGTGKILYYRNPMGLPDTSPTPKKDSMGMEYIPVYDNEEDGGNGSTVKISLAKVQRLGVRTEPAAMRGMMRAVRAVGTVQVDERRLSVVNTKFEGWIEKLHVNATGQSVKRGEPLMEVYAPELVVAQQEYLLAWRSQQDMAGAGPGIQASARQLAGAALQRLKNWDISDDQIRRLQRDGVVARTLTLRAPNAGIVLEKTAVEGMKFAPGEPLYRIADLSSVWLIADVYEQDLALVREGQDVQVTVDAYPGKTFTGKVAFVYPVVTRETRTAKVRIEIPNPDLALKADMYASVELMAPVGAGPALAVPESAVLNSGTRQVVLVDRGEGRFEPREVKLGHFADGYYEILSGLRPDEKVVVSANFLIDAESNLRAALKGFSDPSSQQQAAGQPK